MVGKLIKNELKAGLHFITPIYVITAVLAALIYLFLSISAKNENAPLAALLIIAIALVCLGVFFGTIVAVIANFNKSMFRDQGYLTFTLPVTSGQLLFTKALCSFIWILLSYIINIVLFVGAFLSMLVQFIEDFSFERIRSMLDMLFLNASILMELPWTSLEEIFAALFSIVIFAVVYIFVSTLYTVAQIYFSVSLSNVRPFQKLGMFSTIGIYFAVLACSSVISLLLNIFIPFSLEIGYNGLQPVFESSILSASGNMSFGMGDIGFPIIATVFFFFMTTWFMKHKINLK